METRIHIKVLNVKEDGNVPFVWSQEHVIDMPKIDENNEYVGDIKHVIRGFESFCMLRPAEVKCNLAGWTNIGSEDKPRMVSRTTMPDHVAKQVLVSLMLNLTELTSQRELTIVCSDIADPVVELGKETANTTWQETLKALKANAAPSKFNKGKSVPNTIDPVLSKEQLRKKMREASNQ